MVSKAGLVDERHKKMQMRSVDFEIWRYEELQE
jgi:hypothetical protein